MLKTVVERKEAGMEVEVKEIQVNVKLKITPRKNEE